MNFDPRGDARETNGDARDDAGRDGKNSAPITFVQTADNQVTTMPSITITFAQPVVKDDLIVAQFDFNTLGITATGVTDSLGSSYTVAGPFDGATYRVYIAYAIANASGIGNIVVNVSNPAPNFEARIHEYAGAALAPFDGSAGGAGTTTATDGAASSPIVTSVDGDLLFAAVLIAGGGATAGTGFALRNPFGGDVTEDRTLGAPGSYVATATMNAGAVNWVVGSVAFKPR